MKSPSATPASLTELEIRPYRDGDGPAILAAFNDVFRATNGPGYVERTLEEWRWLFLENPAGHRIHAAWTEDGVCAAQYAALPVRARTPAGETTFCQIVDSFVRPEFRAGLKRPGLFIGTAREALAAWCARGDGLFWGLPVPQAKRISIRFLDYVEWRPLEYLCRPVEDGDVARPGGIELRKVSVLGSELAALGGSVLERQAVVQLRDAAYLNWRYGRRPGRPYELYEGRRNGTVQGFVALRVEHELVPGACSLAELLVQPGDEEMLDALLGVATERARARGRGELLAVFPPESAEANGLLARGFHVVPSERTHYRSIGVRLEQSGLTLDALERGWWYSLGDSDLV